MKLLAPIENLEDKITSINVPEDDAPDWAAGTYNEDDVVIFDKSLYEAQTTTTDQPDVGAAKVPPTWIRLGSINAYKMFDQIIASATVNPDTIVFEFIPNVVSGAIVLLGLVGESVRIEINDPSDGLVYDETRLLNDNSLVIDWFTYFFSPIVSTDRVIFDNIPSYSAATYKVTIDNTGLDAVCGEFIIGTLFQVGLTKYGSTISTDSFSRKTRNPDGTFELLERGFADRVRYDIIIKNEDLNNVRKMMLRRLNKPTVYFARKELPETLTYGFYKNLDIVLSEVRFSEASIEVESLI